VISEAMPKGATGSWVPRVINLVRRFFFKKVTNPDPGAGASQFFGASVAVDGSTIVVGAPFDNDAGSRAGAVFIRTNSGTTFNKVPNPDPGAGADQYFGESVAVDGSTIVVGAPLDNDAGTDAGAVFIHT
jgi:hypothetical protein